MSGKEKRRHEEGQAVEKEEERERKEAKKFKKGRADEGLYESAISSYRRAIISHFER